MENLKVFRFDHLRIISGIIDDLGLVQSIDSRLQRVKSGLEEISPGEAIKGMILNGLGNEIYHYKNKGRPKKESPPQRVAYHFETAIKKMTRPLNQPKNKVHVT